MGRVPGPARDGKLWGLAIMPDNFELALRDIYHGRTSHADIDVVKVGHRKDVYR